MANLNFKHIANIGYEDDFSYIKRKEIIMCWEKAQKDCETNIDQDGFIIGVRAAEIVLREFVTHKIKTTIADGNCEHYQKYKKEILELNFIIQNLQEEIKLKTRKIKGIQAAKTRLKKKNEVLSAKTTQA